ncbi:helix-turn-helix transcriptional regulator [Nonomuraea sp. NN258]|uniref:helix-turn-helix domain-containing protein n=1 Tax=Nonomuraea antri TaxID=2730852 RepID=UPI0015688A22|nr:helix-turn-helix transcriptional regulator [Nonomuraea antri]NRQ39804.1 helix-turn-helix transcriptional regulator [Nonomuraea antri]
MSGTGYQTLLDCRRRSRYLRRHGFTTDQIAVILALDHPATPLRLYRYATGLTAAQTIDAFHHLAGTNGAGLRESRLYDYENWPQAGRRPSAFTLRLLARIYGTQPTYLLTADTLATYSMRDQHTLRQDRSGAVSAVRMALPPLPFVVD